MSSKKIWIVKMEATVEAASATEAILNATKGAKATITVKDARPAK